MNLNQLKLNPSLYQRAVAAAAQAGYSSVEEFIEHAVEKELARLEAPDERDQILARLKGLGYLE